jgi:hypothetical protein
MKTRFKIIETEEYILSISNKQPIENYYYDTNINNIRHTGGAEYAIDSSIKQIIAYQPKNNAPELDLPLLPLLPEIFVEDDVEKLAENSVKDINKSNVDYKFKEIYKAFFIEGYKSATKVYNEEDMRKAIELSRVTYQDKSFGKTMFKYKPGEVIQLTKDSKTPKWFVAEMGTPPTIKSRQVVSEFVSNSLIKSTIFPKLKTTTINNKTYLVGNYE